MILKETCLHSRTDRLPSHPDQSSVSRPWVADYYPESTSWRDLFLFLHLEIPNWVSNALNLGCWWPLVTVVRGGGPGDPLDLQHDLPLPSSKRSQLHLQEDLHIHDLDLGDPCNLYHSQGSWLTRPQNCRLPRTSSTPSPPGARPDPAKCKVQSAKIKVQSANRKLQNAKCKILVGFSKFCPDTNTLAVFFLLPWPCWSTGPWPTSLASPARRWGWQEGWDWMFMLSSVQSRGIL